MHDDARNIALAAWSDFLGRSLSERLGHSGRGEPSAAALELFRAAAASVPAYRQFLAERGVAAEAVATAADFDGLPLLTKDNYMRPYTLPERCWEGRMDRAEMLAVSSGSTGQPLFWPRSLAHELDVATRFEQVFNDAFGADERTTLAVVCFALGNWVGGMYTTNCCRYLAQKGYPLVVATPGNNKAEIFRVVKEMAPLFEQTVLLGYPPFLKDVVDEGSAEGVRWERLNTKLVFAGEVFSEEWRGMLCEKLGSARPDNATASLYGTADAGVLGNETPLSIRMRRLLADHPDLARQIFGESRLPTLVQYDPASRYFQEHEGTLVVSADSSAPLVRYHIADRGAVVDYETMLDLVRSGAGDPLFGLDSASRARVRRLPFVYLFGRADFTVSYFGANVYPENVSVGLEQPHVRQWLTGKFVMEVREGPAGDHRLVITIELRPGVAEAEIDRQKIGESIRQQLCRLNSEFAHYVPETFQSPQLEFRPAGDPEYFPPGIKHRYTRKT